MDVPLVITVIAADRPGLVESVASTIAQCGGNWLESRMARLGGQFAGILRVTVPEAERQKALGALKALESSGLKITVQADEAPVARPSGRIAQVSLMGQDRPGIVRQISEAFARSQVNVEELETECTSAPMTGEILFHAQAKIEIPAQCDTARLREELEKIATDLMVDLTLNEVSPTP